MCYSFVLFPHWLRHIRAISGKSYTQTHRKHTSIFFQIYRALLTDYFVAVLWLLKNHTIFALKWSKNLNKKKLVDIPKMNVPLSIIIMTMFAHKCPNTCFVQSVFCIRFFLSHRFHFCFNFCIETHELCPNSIVHKLGTQIFAISQERPHNF